MSIFNIFSRTQRKAQEPPPMGLVAFMMQNPVWTETNLKNLAEAGFQNCMTVFACVNKIAKAAGGIPWILFQKPKSRDGKKVEYFSHPLLNLLERPNPQMGQSAFIEGLIGFYKIAGNSYALSVGPKGTKKPKELHWLYPHDVEVVPGNNLEPVAGYKYTADPSKPVTYSPDEVLHLRTFHPTNFWYGLSPIKVAAKGVDTLNMAVHWNMKLLQNDMKPPGAIKVEGTLTENQRKTLTKALKEEKLGYENAGLPLILEGAQEWMPFSINPKDADWLNSQKLTIRFICLTLGIPPELMGDSENKTYSNQREAKKALYEETILPDMDFLRDELNNWLTPRFGDRLMLDYDRDSIEALREDRVAIFDRAQTSHFLTINEKRLMTGFDEMPGGDVIYMPISMIPMGGKIGGQDKGLKRKSKNKSFWTAPERKEALWNNFVLRVKAKEKSFEGFALDYIDGQKKRIKKAFSNIHTPEGFDVSAVLDKETEAKEYQKKLYPWYVETFTRAVEAGLSASKGELYDLESKDKYPIFEIPPALEELLQQMVFNSGTLINETIIDEIYRAYKIAISKGWTVEELTQTVLKQIDDFKPWKSRLWARTESAKVENWGQVEGYKKAEFIEYKGWLSAYTPETRDSHLSADAQYADNPIPLDDMFLVDGESLQYPGDPAGSPGNICNCLCTTYPEVVEVQGD